MASLAEKGSGGAIITLSTSKEDSLSAKCNHEDKNCEIEKETDSGERNILKKDTLTIDCSTASDFIDPYGSPDSDGDILGVLDYSPDVIDELTQSGDRFTSYSNVFEPLRFSELMPHVFIRNQPVTVKVVDMEILPSTLNFFNQCVFTIILHHGSTHWTITKKSRQISSLHSQLRLFKTMLKLPAATSEQRVRRQSMRVQMKSIREGSDQEAHPKTKRLVKFPRKSLQRMDRNTTNDVEFYLSNLLHHSLLRSHYAVLEFFEISPISFVRHLGPKLKEGFVKKRSGGRNALACCGGRYKRRWLVLKETCLFCLSPGGGNIRTVMLVDSGFQVSHGFRHTRITKGLLITNLSRSLVLKCDGDESEREWNSAIEHTRNNYASDFSQDNRHLSFAPVRRRSYARWYVDGSWYMSDVADLLELAQEEIFITDWWLSPDIYMKRPDLTGKQWKLNEILKRQAERGVKVFILLYKEVELALGLNSLYTKQNLCQLNPNINVLRHPDHYKGSLYWAHHEKMVIVDQMHAFVGGIDLCYGRWDDYRHKLVDIGHAGRVNPRRPESSLGRLILNTHDLFLKGVSDRSSEDIKKGATKKDGESAEATEEDGESAETHRDEENPPELHKQTDQDLFTHGEKDDMTKGESQSSYILRIPNEEDCLESNPIQKNTESRIVNNVYKSDSDNINGDDSDNSNSSESYVKMSQCDTNEKWTSNTTNKVVVIVSGIKDGEGYEALKTSSDYSNGTHTQSSQSLPRSQDSDNVSEASSLDNVFHDDEKRHSRDVTENVGENFSRAEEVREILSKEEEQKSRGRMTRNFKAVKNLGIDLVVEMKEKKREMKQWTEKKVPRLKRTGSLDSEIGLTTCSEEEDGEVKVGGKSKRLRRKLKRRLRSKGRLTRERRTSSMGSLIDLHKELTYEEVTSVHLWLGKDYVNWITKDLYDPHIPFNDTVDRQQTPRMPWHDIALYVEGPAARDAARHFIQRWNAVKSEKMKNNERYSYLLPKTYKPSSFVPSILQLKHRVKCQVVRSIGDWSGGLSETERSIYNAYVDAIKNAKHFIYIENQFFISSASVGKTEVTNTIAYHLCERIIKAHRNNQTFRVYIVLPLLPAFEGQIGTPSGVAMQYILHYTYQSIINGSNSLIGMLMSANINWQHYLSFSSLRTHDVLDGQLVSELIYVHSKLMIVDDRLVIAGSANINDRSLLGSRDSEVCLVIEDEEFTKGTMNGRDYKKGQFAGSLRTCLFGEHLGVSENGIIDVSDPISEKFFKTWQAIASKNTKIYEEVFSCIPSDSVTTFAELERLRNETPLAKTFPEKATENLKNIQGRLVMYPLTFLKDEILKPGFTNKEFLLPNEMWI